MWYRSQQSPWQPTRLRGRCEMTMRSWMLTAALLSLSFSGCWSASESEVVVYTALDREFSEPILDGFMEDSKIQVQAKYDIESTKTVALVNTIISEGARPRCDVFWNNEILHTLRLKKRGLLAAYDSPAASSFPQQYRSPDKDWYGLAARARVLIVNTEALPDREQWPTSILDLADPKWKGQVAIAKPLFGTTATHAAVLFSHWGDKRAREYFKEVKANADILSGNKQVAQAVAAKRYAFGITDTDDAIIEQRHNAMPVEIIYPDQHQDGIGTLFIPNTICILRGSPNTENAKKLIDHLLSVEVEAALAKGRSAQFPVNPNVEAESDATPDQDVRWMKVDFQAAADNWDSAREFLTQQFATPE